ncbi:hypothetical protein BJX64DRAFT_190384 [Aspergillus heterothallicus]
MDLLLPLTAACWRTVVRVEGEKIRNLEHGVWWRSQGTVKPRQTLKRPSFFSGCQLHLLLFFFVRKLLCLSSHALCHSSCAVILSLPIVSLRSRAFPSLRPRRSQH